MKIVKIISALALILLIVYVGFVVYVRYPGLAFYNIPEYYFDEPDPWRSENEEPSGYENKQFSICFFKRWCSYDYIQKDYFIIYRNNNKYSDKQFGTVKEVKEDTYVIETVDPSKQKSLKEIPKNWVFGKD